MNASRFCLDDLDVAFETPADDDIGDPIAFYEFIDFDALSADDVMSFDASDMSFGDALPAPHQALHQGLCDDDLLEVRFRLEEAHQEAVARAPAAVVTLTLVRAVQTVMKPAMVALATTGAFEPAAVEPQDSPADAVALSAYAIAKATLSATPARRRRIVVADVCQLALL